MLCQSDKSYKCVFRIKRDGPPGSWYERGYRNEYFHGLLTVHHREKANIFIVNEMIGGPRNAFGWVYADDAKLVRWTDKRPPQSLCDSVDELY